MLHILRYFKETKSPSFDMTPYDHLRSFEAGVRNLAAHQVTAITREMIYESTGLEVEVVHHELQHCFECIAAPKKGLCWNGYRRMNQSIAKMAEL
jgi:hypothetical protein